jgi:hypothetical protein
MAKRQTPGIAVAAASLGAIILAYPVITHTPNM